MFTVAVIPPDVETEVVDYLRARLSERGDTAQVSNRYDGQTEAVWVRDDGGPFVSPVTKASRLGVNVFASTRDAAIDRANLVYALLRFSPGHGVIVRAVPESFTGPVPIEDARPRFYLTCELHFRGSAL